MSERSSLTGICVPASDQTFVSNLTKRDQLEEWDENGKQWQQSKLFGREQEIGECLKALGRVSGQDGSDRKSELLLLHGCSGCGKSVLAESLRGPTVRLGGYYTGGKFDQFSGSILPYSAITNALSDLVDLVLIHNSGDKNAVYLERIRGSVKTALGEKAVGASLSALIPNLGRLAGLPESGNESSGLYNPTSIDQTFDQLKVTVRNLIKAIATEQTPLVMFLDDVQWIDKGSLALLKSFVADSDSRHVLIVVAYRDDEADVTNMLSVPQNDSAAQVTAIQLDNLTLEESNAVIASQLEVDDNATTMSLAEIVFEKTNGNPFFLAQLLSLLRAGHYITRANDKTKSWQWDCAKVRAETCIADNVLEVIAQRIDLLNPEVQYILEHAACLGFRFEGQVLATLFDGLNNVHIEDCEEVMQNAHQVFEAASDYFDVPREEMTSLTLVTACLAHAARVGIVESSGTGWFRFSHDRFQQYFYECLGDGREEKNLLIGRILQLDKEFDAELNPLFFILAVDQLNAGCQSITSEPEILLLVRLNMKAAQLARTKSAYWTSRIYIHQALQLRDADALWDVDYELALECCTMAAEINYICSDVETSDENIVQVIRNARSFDDKLPATVITIVSMCNRGHLPETQLLVRETLEGLGRRIALNPTTFQVVRELYRVNKLASKFSDDEMLKLPAMTDQDTIIESQMLRMMGYCAFVGGNQNLLAVVAFRLVSYTCKHGFSEITPYSFAVFGLVQSSLGRISEAIRFGNLSLRALSRDQGDFSHRTLVLAWSFCLHYSRPLDDVHTQIQEAFETSLEYGLTYEVASTGSVVCISMFYRGKDRLAVARKYASTILDQMLEHEFSGLYIDIARIFCQGMFNLSSEAVDSPCILSGDFMKEDVMCRELQNEAQPVTQLLLESMKMVVAVHFEDWDIAQERADKVVKMEKVLQPHYIHIFHLVYTGLIYTVFFNRTRSWKHRRQMNRQFGKLRKLANGGVVICKPFVALLLAERSVAGGKKDAMVEKYLEAIRMLAEEGYVNFQSLAFTQLARNLERYFQDSELAMRYMSDAIPCLKRWGAMRKVAQLRDEFQLLAE